MKLKKKICRLICGAKIPYLYMYFRKKIFGNYIVIFVYHRVSPEKETYFLSGIEPEEFEKQVSFLKENFKIYSLQKLIDGLKSGQLNKKEHENIAVITFDDGYRDNYIYAYPILKKYHIAATFFLTTDYIGQGKLFWWDKLGYIIGNAKNDMINVPGLGKFLLDSKKEKMKCISFLVKKLKRISNKLIDQYMLDLQNACEVTIPAGLGKNMILSWDEIREMKTNGMLFGSHTVKHNNMENLETREVEKEIYQSKTEIEDKLKMDVNSFAYAFGSNFNNERIIKLLENSPFHCAVGTQEKLIDRLKNVDLYHLPRISAGHCYWKFIVKASGIFSDYNNFLRSLKSVNL